MLEAMIFGTFSLSDGEAVLREEDIRAGRLVQLLVYLISHKDKVIMKKRLIELFCSGNSKNPENALKNLVYRLRNELKALGPEEYICTQPGGYQWNPEVPVETDYEKFKRLDSEIRKQPDGPEKKLLCQKTLACYRGDVSIKLASETWIQNQAVDYQATYLRVAKILCDIYERENGWEELEALCRKVVEYEPLDEDIQSWFIMSLQKQQKYNQAMSQYETAKKQFYENLGIRAPEKLQDTFQKVVTDGRIQLGSIESIMEEAGEKEEPHGVFLCDYQIFRQIYRLEVRRVGRIGISEYILLLTVRRVGSLWAGAVSDSGLAEAVALLEKTVRETLRIGDVASRSSFTQYVILLSACSYEAGISVVKRIRKNFLKKVKNRRIELEYELEDLSSAWKEQEAK